MATKEAGVNWRTVALFSGILLTAAAALVAQAPARPAQSARTARPPAATNAGAFPAGPEADGSVLFRQHCAACHGADATGGSGPNLTTSNIVAADVNGNLIGQVVRNGRPGTMMPAFTSLSDTQIQDLAAFLHAQARIVAARKGGRKGVVSADLDTGNAAAGKAYFNGAGGCSSCHSPTGDLAGIASKYPALQLEERMLDPRGAPATVTVTLPSGQQVHGKLAYRDEFTIALTDSTGRYRSWPTSQVKFTVHSPAQAHVALLAKYTDTDIHNLMAYLLTLTGPGGLRAARQAGSGFGLFGRFGPAAPPERLPPAPAGAGVTTAMLLNPPAGDWPEYHGTYTGERHSPLTQITPSNVNQLGLAWTFPGATAMIKSSPLVVNGVMYFSVPNNVWALDATNGHLIWHYQYPPNQGSPIGNRGLGMYHDWLFFMAPDGHLVSLDARNGRVRWIVEVADFTQGYWTSVAPLVVGDHVIVGTSGDFDNLTGYLRAIDPKTGKTQWQFNSTPPPGTPNATTGGNTWMTGTYDPTLNLLYWGTGNPTPVLEGATRPGDDLYTCSILALNPDTGKLVWAFQPSPHDTHDWDAVETPVLVDGTFHGQPRKMLLQASRNGYFFVLDRTDGKSLLTIPFGPVNWAKGVGANGEPIPDPEKYPAQDGRLVAPAEGGLANYRSPSYDPATGLFLVDSSPSYGIYFAKKADGTVGWAGADYGVYSTGILEAIDYKTGKIRWQDHFQGQSGAGVMTTASGLAFTGDNAGNVLAVRTSDGKILWHASTGSRMASSPITYQIDGRQYVVTSSGTTIDAWALSPAMK
jgi:alcohol dehydrogenase (cytochrome c)